MTDSSAENLPLAADFPPANREQWLKLVEGVLKGAPFDRKLVSKTDDGLRIEPLYAGDARATPLIGRTPGAAWQIIQRVDHPDPKVANVLALEDLENGATGLALTFAGAPGAYGFGISSDGSALARVLDGVHLDAGIAIELDGAWQLSEVPSHLMAMARTRNHAPGAVGIRFNFDPLGAMALTGASASAWPELAPSFASSVKELADAGFRGPFAAADGRVVHNSGGSEAQELAFAVSVAVAYLRALESAGIPLDAARGMIAFRLAADADQFLTVAKFRALRKLWARVEEACGLEPKPIVISAETAWRTMTQRDPYVNLLRATIAVFSAGIGGADAVTVLPFTQAIGLPDSFARRLARNIQLVLLEESNLAKVADPAAGSGGLEDLTEKLCHSAWSLFQEIEKAGGIAAALEQGVLQQKVATVRAAHEKAIALRSEALIGTNEFPNINEAPVNVLMSCSPSAAARTERVERTACTELPPIRFAEPFEALRDASDRMLEASGARPKIFLANLGTPAAFTARSNFAMNFFEAGGIKAISNDGFENPSALSEAFKQSGAMIACLCSSDDVYAQGAVDAAKALKSAGAAHIYLAGRPKEIEQSLQAAGVETFIYAGCDALATLRDVAGGV